MESEEVKPPFFQCQNVFISPKSIAYFWLEGSTGIRFHLFNREEYVDCWFETSEERNQKIKHLVAALHII